MLEKRDLYIGGACVAPAAASDRAVIDPATGEPGAVLPLGLPLGHKAGTGAAASRAAFLGWAAIPKQHPIAPAERILAVKTVSGWGEDG